MPNIIEQQDLLKGLPDNRLALLLQKPDAAIPPFLVAAEAQRRQAIRQQFAGQGQNESVVDSLTKQMANVPQNVQAPMQAPPNMPAPMIPQAGIAALQPQQAPQQMAGGGQVQRYQAGSVVTPTFRGRAGAGGYEEASPTWGVLGDLYNVASSGVGSFAENLRRFGVNPTAEQREQLQIENEAAAEASAPEYVDPFVRAGTPAAHGKPPPKPANPATGTSGTSSENKYKAEEAALRSRLEELYGTDEPSNWEEAQKWFAMSAQIMNPDANLLQGLVNAGAVYADAEGEQARQKREGDRALQEALLKWDMNALESERDAAARAAEKQSDREYEMKKLGIPSADNAITAYNRLINDIGDAITDELDPVRKERLVREREGYINKLASIMNAGGFGVASPTREELEAYTTGR